jgi:hypothetical protein
MTSRPALLALIAETSDAVVRSAFAGHGFQVFPPLVTRTIRRYQSHRPFRDVELEIFRDEAWEGPGLRVKVQARVLVHPVQRAFKRAAAEIPLRRFQLGPHAEDLPGSWTVTAPDDVTAYAAGLSTYARDVATPWLRNTESIDAVIAHLSEMKPLEGRDRLIRALKSLG